MSEPTPLRDLLATARLRAKVHRRVERLVGEVAREDAPTGDTDFALAAAALMVADVAIKIVEGLSPDHARALIDHSQRAPELPVAEQVVLTLNFLRQARARLIAHRTPGGSR